MLRVFIRNNSIVISAHHTQQRVIDRLSRLFNKIEKGLPLSVCSLFHGGGVLDSAFHAGLKRTGISSAISVVVEQESKYLDASLRNNAHLWNKDSIVIQSPIQSIDLSKKPPQVDCLIAGIPCAASSKSGRSKNKTWGNKIGGYAESHKEAGTLFIISLSLLKY